MQDLWQVNYDSKSSREELIIPVIGILIVFFPLLQLIGVHGVQTIFAGITLIYNIGVSIKITTETSQIVR